MAKEEYIKRDGVLQAAKELQGELFGIPLIIKAIEDAPTEDVVNLTDDDFGAVLNCAIRYSLGRQTYMPHLVMDFARPLLPQLSDRTLWCMARDIKEAETYGGYGSPVIDEPKWRTFLEDVENEIDKRKEK